MHVQEHLESLKESVKELQRIVPEGLSQHQRTLGFHTSAAAIDMLEILFHERNLIDPGMVLKHEWFNSQRKIEEKFPFDFPRKKEMFSLITSIEARRNKLCYGKRQPEPVLEELLQHFLKLKELFEEVTQHEL